MIDDQMIQLEFGQLAPPGTKIIGYATAQPGLGCKKVTKATYSPTVTLVLEPLALENGVVFIHEVPVRDGYCQSINASLVRALACMSFSRVRNMVTYCVFIVDSHQIQSTGRTSS
jgi:hypothetical protein